MPFLWQQNQRASAIAFTCQGLKTLKLKTVQSKPSQSIQSFLLQKAERPHLQNPECSDVKNETIKQVNLLEVPTTVYAFTEILRQVITGISISPTKHGNYPVV